MELGELIKRNLEGAEVSLFAVGVEAGKPFEVLRAGKYVKGGRTIELTDADLDRMVTNFSRWRSSGQDVPIDRDHSFAERGDSKAYGWYQSLKREGSRLLATVRWTDEARELIKQGAYRYFSPEFTKNWVNEHGGAEGPTLFSGAITNRNFLRGKTAIAMHQDFTDAARDGAIDGLEALLFAEVAEPPPSKSDRRDETPGVKFTVKHNDSEVEVETFTVEVDGEQVEVKADEFEAMHKRHRELEAGEVVTMTKSEHDELTNKADNGVTFAKRLAKVEGELEEAGFNEVFSQAKREGRVDAKDETREYFFEKVYKPLGREGLEAMLERIPPETVPVTMQGEGGGEAPAPKAPTVGGTNQRAETFHQAVEKYAAEKDVPYDEAAEALAATQGDYEEAY